MLVRYNWGMAKNTNVILRVTPEFKEQLRTAADRQGVTLTDFVVAAISTEMARLDAGVDRDVLAFHDVDFDFRLCCDVAARGKLGGYVTVGVLFALGLMRKFAPIQYIAVSELKVDRRWADITVPFWTAIYEDDSEAALAWLKQYRPGYLELVPQRRRDAFLKGVRDHFENMMLPRALDGEFDGETWKAKFRSFLARTLSDARHSEDSQESQNPEAIRRAAVFGEGHGSKK